MYCKFICFVSTNERTCMRVCVCLFEIETETENRCNQTKVLFYYFVHSAIVNFSRDRDSQQIDEQWIVLIHLLVWIYLLKCVILNRLPNVCMCAYDKQSFIRNHDYLCAHVCVRASANVQALTCVPYTVSSVGRCCFDWTRTVLTVLKFC